MSRKKRLGSLIAIAIGPGGFVLYLANFYIISIKDATAKATIAASAITLFGVIFSAMYKEISAYYQERSENINRKWDLIFPFIRNHYNTWINSAESLLSYLDNLNSYELNDEAVTNVLYLTAKFYGYRLRFIMKDGGLILLSTDEEAQDVINVYRQIQKTFSWGNGETPRRVSYLQKLFLSKNKQDDPYVLSTFMDDLQNDNVLKESRDKLRLWLTTKENIENLKTELRKFITRFKRSIDKLYDAWGN